MTGKRITITLWSTWLTVILSAVFYMCQYEFTPGKVGAVPERWNPTSGISQSNSPYPTLFVSLHPKCSCSQATIAELAELFAEPGTKANLIALITTPANQANNWELDVQQLFERVQTELLGKALVDLDAKQAKKFGMLTSGHVLAYAPDGALLFSGGITQARGQRTAGPGLSKLRQIVNFKADNSGESLSKPVFGCELADA